MQEQPNTYPTTIGAGFTTPTDGVFSSGLARDNPVDGSGRLIKGPIGRYSFIDMAKDGLSNTLFIGEKAVDSKNERRPGGWGDGSIYNGEQPNVAMRLGGFGVGIARAKKIGSSNGAIPLFGSYHPSTTNFYHG